MQMIYIINLFRYQKNAFMYVVWLRGSMQGSLLQFGQPPSGATGGDAAAGNDDVPAAGTTAATDPHPKDPPVLADIGLGSVYASKPGSVQIGAPKEPKVYLQEIPERLVFNFVGKVTTVATNNSIKLCDAFDEEFFVEGGVHAHLENDQFLPAWCIPALPSLDSKAAAAAATKAAKANKDTTAAAKVSKVVQEEQVLLQVVRSQLMFKYEYKKGKTNIKLFVPISITSLRMPDDLKASDEVTGQLIRLYRAAIPNQVQSPRGGRGGGTTNKKGVGFDCCLRCRALAPC